jgi:hypothetical protein
MSNLLITNNKQSRSGSLPKIQSFDLKIKKLIQINEEDDEKPKNQLSKIESFQQLPKIKTEPIAVVDNRTNILRSNSINFPGIDKTTGFATSRKPSFFSTYLKYRQSKKKSMLPSTQLKCAIQPVYVISRDKAESIIRNILQNQIENSIRQMRFKSNELETIKSKLTLISSLIKDEIKIHCERHFRVIVNCTVGELKQQGLIIASKCFWDDTKDTSISVKYFYNNFFILVNVFAVHRD